MVILAPSAKERDLALPQGHGSRQVSLTGHALKFAFQSQRDISSGARYLLLRTYFATSFVVWHVLFLAQIFTSQSYLASKFAAVRTVSAVRSICWGAMSSRRFQRLRKRLVFEFFTLIMSPSGNSLFLLVFWPGWLLIVAAVWSLSIWWAR